MKPARATEAAAGELTALETLLRERTGLTVKGEMLTRLSGRLDRFMGARGISDRSAYLHRLRRDPDALQEIVDFLTVNETYFFREPDQIDVFVKRLFPEILLRKPPGGRVRVLSAGCASGEEPYSLVMALTEAHGEKRVRDRIHIVGVDIDRMAIEKARKGIYGRGAFRRFDDSLRRRYFETAEDGRFALHSAIRDRVVFRQYNLLETPFPPDLTGMDVVFYRNVSIYFDSAVQRRIFRNLSDILEPDGYLIVSATETLSHDFHLLRLTERDGIYLYAKGGETAKSVRKPGGRKDPFSTKAVAPLSVTEARSANLKTPPGVSLTPARKSPSGGDRYRDAMAQVKNKSDDAALEILDRILADAPTHIPAKTHKAAILMNRNRPDEARALCEGVLAQESWRTDALLMRGIIAKNNGDPDTAARMFKSVIFNHTDNWLAHFYLATLHEESGQAAAARREYAAVIRLLEKGRFGDHGLPFFPLAFSEDGIIHLCRERARRDLR